MLGSIYDTIPKHERQTGPKARCVRRKSDPSAEGPSHEDDGGSDEEGEEMETTRLLHASCQDFFFRLSTSVVGGSLNPLPRLNVSMQR